MDNDRQRLKASWLVSRLAGNLALIASMTACGMLEDANRAASTLALPFPLHGINGATTSLSIHPFGSVGFSSPSLNLFARGQVNFSDAVQSLVAEKLGNGVQVQLNRVLLAEQVAAGGQRYEGSFLVNGVPIFGTHITANLLNDRTPFILGTLPNITAAAVASAPGVWPDLGASEAAIMKELSTSASSATVSFPNRFYLASASGELKPVWQWTAHMGGLPYDVVADDNGILSMTKRFFEVNGSASVYPKNVFDTALVNYTLVDLTGDGTMTNAYLQTGMSAPYSRAVAPNEIFNYPASDPRFAEANAFSHTDEHFRWIQSIGGQTYGDLPIQLLLHQTPNNTPNNALFIPGDAASGEPFQILIGDGDGTNLANLPTDWDVPSHESGHYFVYNYLKATTDESLGVHEGMADLLVFLQKGVKGDPQAACLGESICPSGTPLCIEAGCLRTADNTWAYDDANWKAWTAQLYPNPCCGHKHGQVLSGVVWDMVKNKVMSAQDASNLTYTAISYFKADSGIRDYLLALLTADKSVFACKYDTQLRQYMSNRNLTTLISDAAPGCNAIPALTGTGNDSLVAGNSGGGGNTGTSGGGKGVLGTGCGVVGAGSSAPLANLLALLPIIAAALYPFAGSALVKVRARGKRSKRRG